MTRENFNSLVNRLEVAWRDRPEGLLNHTVCWVALGYLALAASVLAGLVLFGAGVMLAVHFQGVAGTLLAGAVSLAGLGFACFILGCLWVRFEPPAGMVLARKDHPELHALLADLGDRAGGIRFDRVVLDPEMNASVVQNPRLGIFGWYRTYLIIGLPLMEALPLDELKAVLAHEIGHLTRADGKTGAWLHRTRTTWERVVDRLAQSGCCPLVGGFFNWFWPRFNSRACLLSRFSELAADRFAAQAVSPAALASGLQRLAIVGRRLEEELWEPLEREIDGTGELPRDVMERLAALVRRPMTPAKAAGWLAEGIHASTSSADSHPGLATRLEALAWEATQGATYASALPPGASAAELLLAPTTLDLARQRFSQEWLADALVERGERARRQAPDAAAAHRKAWDRIAALVRLDGLEKVQPEVIALLERHPGHSGALYLRGSHLAERDDPRAFDFLERATEDPTLASRAYETLAKIYARHGRNEDAHRAATRGQQHDLELRAALVERGRASADDRFFPHDLNDSEREALRQILDHQPAVRRAWLAAKEVRHFPHWPNVVIALEFRDSLAAAARRELDSRLMQLWCGEAYVVVLAVEDATKPVLRALRRALPDSEVYHRR